MSTYDSNSADIDDGSSKRQQSATVEEIPPENDFCLKESSVRKRKCSSSPSDTEGGDLNRQRLGNFEKIATDGKDNSSIASEDEEDSSIAPEDKKDSSIAPEDNEDSPISSEDREDSSISSEDIEDSSTSSEDEDYVNLSPQKNDKLNAFIGKIVTEAAVDFSNQEIQDIKSAVTEMIERIKAGINERGLFSISRTELCGSMAEETAMWKLEFMLEKPYIEFDFLAVLQATIDIQLGCPECFYVNPLPVNVELREKYYRDSYELTRARTFDEYAPPVNTELREKYYRKSYELTRARTFDEYFTAETNNCLTSCGCLNVEYPCQDDRWTHTFEPSSTCSKTLQGCDKCTVDTPTGTLRVKTSVEIGSIGEGCSLIFNWTSKAKTLCTRDQWCLPENEKMDNLAIHIDFLPALEVFQSKQQSADVAACSSSGLVLNPTGSEDEHYCFLVPKHCVVCDKYGVKDTWRRSGCQAEIDTVVNKMTDKHRKCYQVLKHLSGFNNYHLKIAVLHHNNSCSDANEDCAKCVFKVLDDLQHAYSTEKLKSFHSQANLLEQKDSDFCNYCSQYISTLKEAICSAVSKSDSVSSFLKFIF